MSSMYNDTDSKEITSTENLTPIDQFCEFCKIQMKNKGLLNCIICNTSYCQIHQGLFSEINSQKICSACSSDIKRMQLHIIKQLKVEKNNNKKLTLQIINSFKELQEIKNSINSNRNNISMVETLVTDTKILREEFQDSIKEILNKNQEIIDNKLIINELNEKINENNKEIERYFTREKE